MSGDSTRNYRTADGSAVTPTEESRLDVIEARLGEDVDIPETSEAAWQTAVRGRHGKVGQEAVSVRLDAEVLAWIRSRGPSSSVEINRILREKMEAEGHT